MLIAFFADIHANRQAFEACLAQARADGAERVVLLGDYVGYGADPEWSVDAVIELVDKGAVAVLGNHDSAVNSLREQMNAQAQIAIEWTRNKLAAPERQFLAGLPFTHSEDDRLYMHADASAPQDWHYVTNAMEAATSISATRAHVSFCGHIHRPALYSLSSTAKMSAFIPTTGVAIPLLPGRQWLAVLGSVGQPRDGNPAASYAMLDTSKNELTYCRAAYDIEEAASRIRKNGLPLWLAERLFLGT